MKRDYPRLDWRSLARQMIKSGDLDPIYIMLDNADLEPAMLKRWLLGYWCFYDSSAACALATSGNFYQEAVESYQHFGRGHERRHFRGAAGLKCIEQLRNIGSPEQVVDGLMADTFAGVAEKVDKLHLFGPWITWKIADMFECLGLAPVDFTGCSLNIYSEPVKGAALILHGDQEAKITPQEVNEVVCHVVDDIDELAPPRYRRKINVQEAETILCKYKAHINGFYPLNNDIIAVKDSLLSSNNWLANKLLGTLPCCSIEEGILI